MVNGSLLFLFLFFLTSLQLRSAFFVKDDSGFGCCAVSPFHIIAMQTRCSKMPIEKILAETASRRFSPGRLDACESTSSTSHRLQLAELFLPYPLVSSLFLCIIVELKRGFRG